MKKVICLTLIIICLTGCSISKINDDSFDNIINSILYKDTNLFNMSFDGYKFYLPRGATVEEKDDYNLEIKNKNNTYYLYVDTIAYYYKANALHEIDNNIIYSRNLNYKQINGYVDILEVDQKYFIEMMYNFAKVEAYVEKDDLYNSFTNICYILSTINFNESAINYKLSTHDFDSTTEEYSIFKSKKDDDNFLQYVKEFDKYDNSTAKSKDNDVIETDEGG